MDHLEPPEPSAEEQAIHDTGAVDGEVVIRVPAWNTERVQAAVVAVLTERITKRIDNLVDRIVRDKIDDLVVQAVGNKVNEAVGLIIDEGFVLTTRYGQVEKRISLRERIEETLEPKPDRSGYSYDNEKAGLKGMVDEKISRALDNEVKSIKDTISKRVDALLKSAMDAAITDKLRYAIKSAFGIQT